MKELYRKLEAYAPAAVFLLISVVMLLQVFARVVFRLSFAWSLEFSRYAEVWLTFIGIAYLRRINAHIKIESVSSALDERLSPRGRVVFHAVKSLVVLTFMVLLVVLGLQLALRTWNLRSSAMQVRQFWLYIVVPIGAAGFVAREIQTEVRYLRGVGETTES